MGTTDVKKVILNHSSGKDFVEYSHNKDVKTWNSSWRGVIFLKKKKIAYDRINRDCKVMFLQLTSNFEHTFNIIFVVEYF